MSSRETAYLCRQQTLHKTCQAVADAIVNISGQPPSIWCVRWWTDNRMLTFRLFGYVQHRRALLDGFICNIEALRRVGNNHNAPQLQQRVGCSVDVVGEEWRGVPRLTRSLFTRPRTAPEGRHWERSGGGKGCGVCIDDSRRKQCLACLLPPGHGTICDVRRILRAIREAIVVRDARTLMTTIL